MIYKQHIKSKWYRKVENWALKEDLKESTKEKPIATELKSDKMRFKAINIKKDNEEWLYW